jgi:hypothetical protein
MSNDTELWLGLITALAAGLIFLRIVCKEKARLDRHIHIRELYEERKARLRQMEADYERERSSGTAS